MQLAEYLGKTDTQLYAYQSFAIEYTAEEAEELGRTQMSNGKFLTYAHAEQLMRVTSKDMRKKLTNKCVSKGWSSHELKGEINATAQKRKNMSGGRKVGRPTSPIAGLIGLSKSAGTLNNRLDVWESDVFDELDQIEPDRFDNVLCATLSESEERLLLLQGKVESAIKRVHTLRVRADSIVAAAVEEEALKVTEPAIKPAKKSKGSKKVASKKAASKPAAKKVTKKSAKKVTKKTAKKSAAITT